MRPRRSLRQKAKVSTGEKYDDGPYGRKGEVTQSNVSKDARSSLIRAMPLLLCTYAIDNALNLFIHR